jgi:hypothetical protein
LSFFPSPPFPSDSPPFFCMKKQAPFKQPCNGFVHVTTWNHLISILLVCILLVEDGWWPMEMPLSPRKRSVSHLVCPVFTSPSCKYIYCTSCVRILLISWPVAPCVFSNLNKHVCCCCCCQAPTRASRSQSRAAPTHWVPRPVLASTPGTLRRNVASKYPLVSSSPLPTLLAYSWLVRVTCVLRVSRLSCSFSRAAMPSAASSYCLLPFLSVVFPAGCSWSWSAPIACYSFCNCVLFQGGTVSWCNKPLMVSLLLHLELTAP